MTSVTSPCYITLHAAMLWFMSTVWDATQVIFNHLFVKYPTVFYNEDRLLNSKPFWFFVFDRIFIARRLLFANARMVFFVLSLMLNVYLFVSKIAKCIK